MKNIVKSIFAAALVVISITACNVDNVKTTYTPQSENEVSFVQSNVVNTELPASATSAEITLGRTSTKGELTVSLDISQVPTGISCPSSVTFADGEGAVDLWFDLSKLEVGVTKSGKVALKLNEGYNKTAAIDTVTFKFAKAYEWEPYGTCKYTEDLWTTYFSVSNVTYTVNCEKAKDLNVFRLIDPYGENYPYNDPGDWEDGVKWVFNCIDPTKVLFERTDLGLDWGYGQLYAYPLQYGKFENNTITFPTRGIAIGMGSSYGPNYSNLSGKFKIDFNK